MLFFFIFSMLDLYVPPSWKIPIGPARAAADTAIWDGTTVATYWAGGAGTAGDPYQIETAAQLAWLAERVNNGETFNGKHFKLIADVNLDGGDYVKWTPIGIGGGAIPPTSNYFDGVFDGDGHTIAQMMIGTYNYEGELPNAVGLFGFTGSGAIIKNVGVTDLSISAPFGTEDDVYAGGLVGYANGSNISSCYATGNYIFCDSNGDSYAGGLIGYLDGGRVDSSYASVNIESSHAGGLVGALMPGGEITHSFSLGEVSPSTGVGGGLAGVAAGNVTSAFAVGDVNSGSGTVAVIGGLVGRFESDTAELKTSYYFGTVSSAEEDSTLGALIGEIEGSGTPSITGNNYNIERYVTSGPDPIGEANGVVVLSDDVFGTVASSFRSASKDYFTGRGWDFDETWLYTMLDNEDRPYLRAFFDIDADGGAGDYATISPDMTSISPGHVVFGEDDTDVRIYVDAAGWEDSVSNIKFSSLEELSPTDQLTFNGVAISYNYEGNEILLEADAVDPLEAGRIIISVDYDVMPPFAPVGEGQATKTFVLTVLPDEYEEMTNTDVLSIDVTANSTSETYSATRSETNPLSWDVRLPAAAIGENGVTVAVTTSNDNATPNLIEDGQDWDYIDLSAPLTFEVIASDDETRATYTLTATPMSSNTEVVSITAWAGVNSYDVTSTGDGSWNVHMPSGEMDAVSLDIVLSDDKSAVSVGELTYDPVNGVVSIGGVDFGEGPFNFFVIPEDDTAAEAEYTITATAMSSETAVTGITVWYDAGLVVSNEATSENGASWDVRLPLTQFAGVSLDIELSGDKSKVMTVADNNLGNLTLSASPSSPTFAVLAEDGTLTNYTLAGEAMSSNTEVTSITVVAQYEGSSLEYIAASSDSTTWSVSMPSILLSSNVSLAIELADDNMEVTSPDISGGVSLASEFKFVVTAEDGTDVDYTLTATPLSNVTTVEKFSVTYEGGTYEADYQSGEEFYLIKLPRLADLTSLSVVTNTTDPNATVSPTSQDTRNFTDTTHIYTVTAEDRITSEDYEISIISDKSSNASVDKFIVSVDQVPFEGELTLISEDNYEYRITLPSGTDLEDVTLGFLLPPGAILVVDAVTEADNTNGTGFLPVELNLDFSNGPVTITIIAEDGTTITYVIYVIAPSNVTSPDLITAIVGEVVRSTADPLSTDIYAYEIVLPFGTSLESVTVSVDPPAGASIDKTMPFDDVNFTTGEPWSFKILAEDGVTSADYSLLVVEGPSTITEITAIKVTSGDVARDAVSTGETTWSVTMPSILLTSVSLDITLSDPGASVVTTGLNDLDLSSQQTIRVLAEDGVTSTDYTLSAVGQSNSTQPTLVTATPTDDSALTTSTLAGDLYEIVFPYGTDLTSVSVSLDLPAGATTSPSTPTDVNFSSVNPWPFKVTAQDGITSADYRLSVTTSPSNVATISGFTITLNGTDYDSTESGGVYTITLPRLSDLSELYVVTNLMDSGATVSPTSAVSLDFESVNQWTFTVTAADGVATATYDLTVVCAKSSNSDVGDDGFSVTIDGTTYTATSEAGDNNFVITVPEGTNITSVALDFELPDGAQVLLPDGTLGNPEDLDPFDFSEGPQTITIVAEDGSETTYTIEIVYGSASVIVAEFYVRNVPLTPAGAGTSYPVYIEWKSTTDDLSYETAGHSSDLYPAPMPIVSWDIETPEGGGTWDVSVAVDPSNPFAATLSVGSSAGAGRELYRVAVDMRQLSGDVVVFEEYYTRGFYVGEPFPTTVLLSPEAEEEIDRVNAILARSDVEIVPGNHQQRIPQHILNLVIEFLRNNLVTYSDVARRGADGCDDHVTVVRTGYAPAYDFSQTENIPRGEESMDILIIEEVDHLRMEEEEPDPNTLPECFVCTDKLSANIELDLTKLSAADQEKIVMVPMSYTVTIRSNDMNEFYGTGLARDIVNNPVGHLDDIFDVLVLHKRIHEGAMEGWYTRLVRGVAQPKDAYDTGMLLVWSDKVERSLTVSLAYYVINYHGESFVIRGFEDETISTDLSGADGDIAYIILPDGLRNNRLIDPLWTNIWRTSTTPIGDGGDGGGGCSTPGAAALLLLALLIPGFAARRKRR